MLLERLFLTCSQEHNTCPYLSQMNPVHTSPPCLVSANNVSNNMLGEDEQEFCICCRCLVTVQCWNRNQLRFMNIHMEVNGKKCLPKDCLLIHVSKVSLCAQQNNYSCSGTSTYMYLLIQSAMVTTLTSSFSIQKPCIFLTVCICVKYDCQNKND